MIWTEKLRNFLRIKSMVRIILMAAALLMLPFAGRAQFSFTTNNGTITITGYTGTNSSVIIPAETNGYPVTDIGLAAFSGCTNLAYVSIPDTVGNIDVEAFENAGLTNLVIPDSVTNIDIAAFLECTNLIEVTTGNGVMTIGGSAFSGCDFTNFVIPASLTNIANSAFDGCTNLTAFEVAAQNPAYSSLDGVLFDKAQKTICFYPQGLPGNYVIPGSVTDIGPGAFADNFAFTNVTIPPGVVAIQDYAFFSTSLSDLTIPNGVAHIGIMAIYDCTYLTNISVSATVTNIGAQAFGDNYNLQAITVDEANGYYKSVDGILFDKQGETLLQFPNAMSGTWLRPGSYAVPGNVTIIGDGAFQDCYFESVTLPVGVASLGDDVFLGCSLLTNLVLPDTITNIGGDTFAFSSLTNLVVPASVTTFGWVGNRSSLESIYFLGDAPKMETGTDQTDYGARYPTVYYLPGTTGWGSYFQVTNIPTALWLPQAQAGDGSFGIKTNGFGFNISWAPGETVVVDACTNLASPVWQPVQTNVLTTGSAYFSEPGWTNYAKRFYRLRMP